MADETPPQQPAPEIGTASIRRVVEATRAQSANGVRIPAPPPDQTSAPWAGAIPPEPDNLTTPRAQAQRQIRDRPPPPAITVAPPPPIQRGKLRSIPQHATTKSRQAWRLLETLMESWSEESKTSLGKANNLLSQRLGKNGVTLLREGIPMGAVGDLVRLCNELARDSKSEAEEDPRIEEMQRQLKREVPELTYDDEPQAEGDDEDAPE